MLIKQVATALGMPNDHGFPFSLADQHLATVKIGRNFVELEAGPDRVERDIDTACLLYDRIEMLLDCLGIEGIEPQAVLLGLDQAGIAAHSGSAWRSFWSSLKK